MSELGLAIGVSIIVNERFSLIADGEFAHARFKIDAAVREGCQEKIDALNRAFCSLSACEKPLLAVTSLLAQIEFRFHIPCVTPSCRLSEFGVQILSARKVPPRELRL